MNTRNRIIRAQWTGAIGLILLAAMALAPQGAWAQATPNPPGQISYQGYVTDANGVPLATNTPVNYDIFFHVYDAAQGGNVLWGELQTVTVNNGYFSVLLGQGTSAGDGSPWTNNLTSLFGGATASDRYVGITVRSFQEIQPRLRLLSSPYALLAANSVGLVGNTGVQVLNATGTNIAVNGSSGNNSLDIHGSAGIFGNGFLQFGEGFANQSANAGEIGYELLSPNALDIIGAGTTGNRRIKLWAEAATSTTGRLGVGTDSPSTMLHVLGAGDTEISIQSSDSGNRRWTLQSTGNANAALTGTFQIIDRNAGAARMSFATSGNIGINTTSPGATLEVNGNTYLDGYVGIPNSQVLEFGRGISGKEGSAGKMGYGTFTANTLDIVGGGNSGSTRAIKLWAEGGTTMTGGLSVSGPATASAVGINTTVADGVFSMNGFGHLNDFPFYFRGGTDHNHWLGYTNTVYDVIYNYPANVDGPFLVGFGGGALGTRNNGLGAPRYSLRWDTSGNVVVPGSVSTGVFAVISDRNMKRNFKEIDTKAILDKVVNLPVTTWEFTNSSLRHTGPIAQDFHKAFGGTEDEKHISLGDEVGVSLAAIKGLNQVVESQSQEIQILKQQLQVLQSTVETMKRAGSAGSKPTNSLNAQ